MGLCVYLSAVKRTCKVARAATCERHVDGRGRVSDSRDQNTPSREREVLLQLMILSLPFGYAAVIAGMTLAAHQRKAQEGGGGKSIRHCNYMFSFFFMINLRLEPKFPAVGLGNIFPLQLAC